ncbi:TPA: hypothetical protein ACGU2V_000488 [Enterococcus faecium]
MKKMKKYKIRKSGNSDVTTIPPEVKEFMGVQTGDAISYVFQSDGSVRMIKAQEEPDIDSLRNDRCKRCKCIRYGRQTAFTSSIQSRTLS